MRDESAPPSWVREHKMDFGAGSIRDCSWHDMNRVVRECGAQTVLELGCGFSTVCFDQAGLFVTCLETKKDWIHHMLSQTSGNVTVIQYEYPYLPDMFPDGYDIAFVDGPPATMDGRFHSMMFAAGRSKRVFVHDSRRKSEVQAIAKVFDREEWIQTVYDGGLSLFVHKSLGELYVKPKNKKKS